MISVARDLGQRPGPESWTSELHWRRPTVDPSSQHEVLTQGRGSQDLSLRSQTTPGQTKSALARGTMRQSAAQIDAFLAQAFGPLLTSSRWPPVAFSHM